MSALSKQTHRTETRKESIKEDELSFQSIDGAETESESVQEVEDTEEERSPTGLRRSARKSKKIDRLGVHTSVPSSKDNTQQRQSNASVRNDRNQSYNRKSARNASSDRNNRQISRDRNSRNSSNERDRRNNSDRYKREISNDRSRPRSTDRRYRTDSTDRQRRNTYSNDRNRNNSQRESYRQNSGNRDRNYTDRSSCLLYTSPSPRDS